MTQRANASGTRFLAPSTQDQTELELRRARRSAVDAAAPGCDGGATAPPNLAPARDRTPALGRQARREHRPPVREGQDRGGDQHDPTREQQSCQW